jgi:hypothetical protein
MRLRLISITLLVTASLTGCAKGTDPAQSDQAAKVCENIVKQFNEKLLSEAKNEKIQGWQLVINNPTCFLPDAVKIAQTEIAALQSQQ